MKEKNLQPDYYTQQGSHSNMTEQSKAQRIQHHQTSSSTNAKGSSPDKKHRKGL